MTKHLLLLLSLSFLLATACKKKEKDTIPATNAEANSFTLKKDGVPYTAGKITVTSPTANQYIGIQAHLSASQVNIETYSMSLTKDVQPGVYNDDNTPISLSSICAFIHIYNETHVYYMDDGEITVLSNDTVAKKIEFNFKFNLLEDAGTGSMTITEGHAKVAY